MLSSFTSCTFRHDFPWTYRHLDFSNAGRMQCPGCGLDLESAWGIRSGYSSKLAFKHT